MHTHNNADTSVSVSCLAVFPCFPPEDDDQLLVESLYALKVWCILTHTSVQMFSQPEQRVEIQGSPASLISNKKLLLVCVCVFVRVDTKEEEASGALVGGYCS